MKIKILESKKIEHRYYYLCKCNLLDYLENLKESFYEYAIQRKIVKNQYLDKLYSTIKIGDPIPTITITYNSKIDNIVDGNAEIDLSRAEILDGLQRSFRLWTYLFISKKDSTTVDYRSFARNLKDENQLFFDSGVLSTKLIKSLIETSEINEIQQVLSNFEINLTIWTGLTEKEIIHKMLVLNAGQKSVSKTHQFELLFLHFFDALQESGIKLYREKDIEANDIKRGKREIGQFMFSSTIVALQSFVDGKPLRVSTEKLIDHEFEDNTETTELTYDLVFNTEFMLYFISKLIELDKLISEKEEIGKEWFSKDTTLSGVFAGIGSIINTSNFNTKEEIIKKTNEVFISLTKNINKYGYKLTDFTSQYNNLSSRSVNIGSFIRTVIMDYTVQLINGKNENWNQIFNNSKEGK